MPGSRSSRDPPNTATGFRLLTRTIQVGDRYWRFYRSHHTNPPGWDLISLAPVEQRPLLEWDSALADALDDLEVVIKP